jgi:hypothetical protein
MATPVRRDTRRQPRFHVESKVHLHWITSRGGLERLSGFCVEVSPTGMRVRLDRVIPLQALVNLQSPELRLAGEAVVRHCARRSGQFLVGLEFVGGLEWRPPHGTV